MVGSSIFFILALALAFGSYGRRSKNVQVLISPFLCCWPAFALTIIAMICSALSIQSLALTASVGLIEVGVERGEVAFVMECLIVAITGILLIGTGTEWMRIRKREQGGLSTVAPDLAVVESAVPCARNCLG